MPSDFRNKYRLKLSDGTYRDMWFIGNVGVFGQFLDVCAKQGRWLTGTIPETAGAAAEKRALFNAGKVASVQQIESVSGVYDRRDGEFYKTIRCGRFMYEGKLHELEWMAEDLRYVGKNKLKPLGTPAPSGGGRLYTMKEISRWANDNAPSSYRIDFDGMPLVADTDADGVDAVATDVTLAAADTAVALAKVYLKTAMVVAEEATDENLEGEDKKDEVAPESMARKAVETVRKSQYDAQKALDEAEKVKVAPEAPDARDNAQVALESTQNALAKTKLALEETLTLAQKEKLEAAESLLSVALNKVLPPVTRLTNRIAREVVLAVTQAAVWLAEDAWSAAQTVATEAAKDAITQVTAARDKAQNALTEAREALKDSPDETLAGVYNILANLIGDADADYNEGVLGEFDENSLYAPHSVRESRQAMPKTIKLADNAIELATKPMDDKDNDYADLISKLNAIKKPINDLDSKLGNLATIHSSLTALKAKRYYAPERGWRIPRYSDIALLSAYALGGIIISGTIVPNSLREYPFYIGENGRPYIATSTAEKLSNLLSEDWPYVATDGKIYPWDKPEAIWQINNAIEQANKAIENAVGPDYDYVRAKLNGLKTAINNLDSKLGDLTDINASLVELNNKLRDLLSEDWLPMMSLGKVDIQRGRKRLGFDATVQTIAKRRRRYNGYAIHRIEANGKGGHKTGFASFYVQTSYGSRAVTLMSGTVIDASINTTPRALRLVRSVLADS